MGKNARMWTLVEDNSVASIGLPWCLSSKESTCQCRRHGFDHWVGKIPQRRKWQPTPVFLPGKSHGQRSLGGFRPWGRKESDTTERLNWTEPGASLDWDGKKSACNAGDVGSIPGSGKLPGEGNGNPLQYSCLENPMDRGAWGATVHRVAKNWTQLSN